MPRTMKTDAEVTNYLATDKEWDPVWDQLQKRREIIGNLTDGKFEVTTTLELSAIDLFVEKAQHKIGHRAFVFFIIGVGFACAVAAVVTGLISYVLLTSSGSTSEEIAHIEHLHHPILIFIVYTTSKLTIAGITLGLAFYLAGQSRSYIHESLTAYARRHAVRMGRLYLYLKFGGMKDKDLIAQKKSLTVDSFISAFGGHKESTTAFKEIRSEEQFATNWFSTLVNGLSRFGLTLETNKPKKGA